MAVDVVGLAHQSDDALRQRGRIGGIGDRVLHDDEFIAAHPRDGVGLADQPAQPLGDDFQELVAGGVTERVVDGLELIEVEMVNRHHFSVRDPVQRAFEPVVQQHAIGQTGQRVVMRHIFDLDLGLPLLGDVLMGGDPAAIGHRPVTDLEGAAVAQFDDAVGGDGRHRDLGAPVQIFFPRHRGKAADLKAHVDDFGQRRAGTDAIA